MKSVRFGNTGLMVSKLCLGTMTFGLQTGETESWRILDHAFDAGIYFIDTANVYPLGGGIEHAGRTEEIVGTWLKGRRDQVVLATKFVGEMGTSPLDAGASRRHIFAAVDASLRRLGTDYIDLYQLHRPDPGTPIEETLEALTDLVKIGKVRYIGCSNFPAWRVARSLGHSEHHGFAKFASLQPRYNLLFREIERELLPLAAEEGLAVIPFNPIAGGMLSGKHRDLAQPAPGTRFNSTPASALYRRRYWHQDMLEIVAELGGIAKEAGVSLVTLAVAWVLANPAVTSPIIGASSAEQLVDSIQAAEFELDQELKAKLDALTADYRKGDWES